MAWQCDNPEVGQGVVQGFRREYSPEQTMRFKLRGLEAKAKYAVTDVDINKPREMNGHDLMEQGLLVNIPHQPGAVIITYKKVK
jgi:alpha-galactosidase